MGWNTYKKYDFERPETYLEVIGVEHASSITNTAKLSTVLAFAIVVYILVIIYYLISACGNAGANSKKKAKWLFIKFSTLVFLKFISLSFIYILLACIPELFLDSYDQGGGMSQTFALGEFLAMLTLMLFAFICWIYACNSNRLKDNVCLKDFFRGLKNKDLSRLYPFLWMLRRLVF